MNCLKNKIQISFVLFACLFLAAGSTFSQSTAVKSKGRFSIEVDPATFVFKGYGLHARYQPKGQEHLLLGLGAYAMDMPQLLVEMNPDNRDKGWEVRLNMGVGLFAEYFFCEANQKWFVGGQLGLQEYKVGKEETSGTASFANGLLMGYAGYVWQPFDFPIYIKPWAGLGYTQKISGENELGGEAYEIAPLTMFATLHLGYSF